MIKKPKFSVQFESKDVGKYFVLSLKDEDYILIKVDDDMSAVHPESYDNIDMDLVIDAKEFDAKSFMSQSVLDKEIK